VKPGLLGRHRTLLFRSYLFLVAGLLSVAALLDLGFGYLESSLAPDGDRWPEVTLRLIETELAAVAPGQRNTVAETLGREVGVTIRLLDRNDVASPTESTATTATIETLVDANGDRAYLYAAPLIDQLVYLGPLETTGESLVLRLLPPLFYLSIFVIVGLWLRPLLKDLNLITSAAQRFAADYREPLSTANRTTQLTSLANHLDDMSARLSGLIQSQKELIAALSHEMRTPLARIRFALAVMDNDADAELKARLGELNGDVQEIDQLIATMLDYARLDHPDLRMNWQQVPVEPWLAEIRDKLHHPGKELELIKGNKGDTADDLEVVWMDPHLMGLAVSNLLSNAGRYATKRIRCHVLVEDGSQRIEVHDDGKGIPESEREAVFKAFTRLDDSRNRDTGGYGLGLAVVSRIVELHGGSVSVGESPELGGALFTLEWNASMDRDRNTADRRSAIG